MTLSPSKPGQLTKKKQNLFQALLPKYILKLSSHLFYTKFILSNELVRQYSCILCRIFSLEKKYL